jgi:hypothetical protein
MSRTWPPTGGYFASAQDLGFAFSYPADYAESIAWQNREIEAGRQELELGFLQVNQIVYWLATAMKASRKLLVPFARGDNGDWLCCFDASDSSKVYVINLGDKKLRAAEWSSSGYVGFLNEYWPISIFQRGTQHRRPSPNPSVKGTSRKRAAPYVER